MKTTLAFSPLIFGRHSLVRMRDYILNFQNSQVSRLKEFTEHTSLPQEWWRFRRRSYSFSLFKHTPDTLPLQAPSRKKAAGRLISDVGSGQECLARKRRYSGCWRSLESAAASHRFPMASGGKKATKRRRTSRPLRLRSAPWTHISWWISLRTPEAPATDFYRC